MTIKEKIENNVIVAIIAVSVAVGGTTIGIAKYLYEQKLQGVEKSFVIKIEELESRLASIKRDLPGIEHFDIRGLFQSDNSLSPIDNSLHYFDDDKFYASITDEYWNYSKSNEIELIKMVTNIDVDSGILKALATKSDKYPVHLWKANEMITFVNEEVRMNLFPHILLQRIPYSGVSELMGVGISFFKELEEEGEYDFDADHLEQTQDAEELLNNLNELFYNDAAGMFFFFQNIVSFQSAMASPNERFKIIKIQKLGNVLYSQSLIEFSGVEVNDKKTDVYVRQELIIVGARTNLYLIKITLPSLEPTARTPVYANVNRWLTSVKFIMN